MSGKLVSRVYYKQIYTLKLFDRGYIATRFYKNLKSVN